MIAVTAGYSSRPYVQHLAQSETAQATLCGQQIRPMSHDDGSDLPGRTFRTDVSAFPMCGLCEVRRGQRDARSA